jgi:hypothetical protein
VKIVATNKSSEAVMFACFFRPFKYVKSDRPMINIIEMTEIIL